ncbi:histidine phosphatase family protein [uncultured Paraglaciecola sp.]|uniref:histidine phosphatase family protein n=1 Tax=uncultured Paraglaciecola sp. TaxID=1765024 RepID=UPI0030DC7D34|tara:strand:- start:116 stop:811 length:696 start_codon:yes stop_codon:yes gene_type:complete
MTAIYLIRHGQASFGKAEYDCLSELGEQQAAHLGDSFKARIGSFDKVVLGSMQRHHQTAQGCLTAMGQTNFEMHQDAGWNEYDHQDILAQFDPELATAKGVKDYVGRQDNPHKALEHVIAQAFSRWIGSLHNQDYIESWPEYQHRIQTALANLISRLDGEKRVAVFSSGGPIALLSQAILGVPAENLMTLNWTLVNCGITKLINTKKRVILSTLNEHSVFEGKSKHLLTYK